MELRLHAGPEENQHETNDHRGSGGGQRYLHHLILHDSRLERPNLGYFFVSLIAEVRVSQADSSRKDENDAKDNHDALHGRYLTTNRRDGVARGDTLALNRV